MNIRGKLNKLNSISFFIVIGLMVYDHFNKNIYLTPILFWYIAMDGVFDRLIPLGLKYKKENKMVRYFIYSILPVITCVVLTVIFIHNYATGFLTIYHN